MHRTIVIGAGHVAPGGADLLARAAGTLGALGLSCMRTVCPGKAWRRVATDFLKASGVMGSADGARLNFGVSDSFLGVLLVVFPSSLARFSICSRDSRSMRWYSLWRSSALMSSRRNPWRFPPTGSSLMAWRNRWTSE